MEHWPNLLIVAGTGRNVGKTTLVAKIIQELGRDAKFCIPTVVALKITPHFHSHQCEVLHKDEHFCIALEKNAHTEKDTSKMLRAGAEKVYFVQAPDAALPAALALLLPLLPKDSPIVCESAVLRDFLQPGLFVVLTRKGEEGKVQRRLALADRVLDFEDIERFPLQFFQGKWVLE